MSQSHHSSVIESMLFASSKPLSAKKIALQLGISLADVRDALAELSNRFSDSSGIVLIMHDDSVQLVTNPLYSDIIASLVKSEITGELTRSASETLSIIAYRGPLTREEIEHIRGVNCSIALRNLLLRGLIDMKEEKVTQQINYSVAFDFLRHLGLQSISELPDYQHFHSQKFLQQEAELPIV